MNMNASAGSVVTNDRIRGLWNDKAQWPNDSPGYIFAARALLRLGAARYREDWSDKIPAVKLTLELPEIYNLNTPFHHINRACEILRRTHEPYRARSALGFFGLRGSEFPTQDEWQFAREQSKKEAAASWAAFRPFATVTYELAEAAKLGKVKTALRPLAGGNIEAQEWHFWNTEHSWLRFETCCINAASPFQNFDAEKATHWIFVEEASFNALVEGKQERVELPKNFDNAPQRTRRASGRKAKYDWLAYLDQLTRRYTAESIPESDYEVENQMSEWCLDNFGDLPASSQQRERIATFRACLLRTGSQE